MGGPVQRELGNKSFPWFQWQVEWPLVSTCNPSLTSGAVSLSIVPILNIPHGVQQRHDKYANKGLSGQSYGFSSNHVWVWELHYKESWASKNWCFWTVVLEKTLESPLDCKEIQPIHPKGNQSWIFIGRTDAEAQSPILWPPDVKNWLLRKDPDAEKDWRREKGTTKDEMVGWHHRVNGHEFE